MVLRFTHDARAIVTQAESEARQSHSPAIEAEHLLLAIAANPQAGAAGVLNAVGLDHTAIESALDQEFTASLAAAGVTVAPGQRSMPTPELVHKPRMGASAKAALERSVRAASGSPQLHSTHLLEGVLGAQLGRVPRALHLAGIDKADLVARAHDASSS